MGGLGHRGYYGGYAGYPYVLTDTDTTTAKGLLMPNLRLMLMPLLMPTTDTTAVDTVDTMAVDTDTVTDTDTTVKLLLKQQIFKAIFPHLQLSFQFIKHDYPPALTYIQKKVKNIWTKSKKFDFFLNHLVRTVPIMISVISNYPLS